MSEPKADREERFVEGRDYYIDDGLFVMTGEYLLRRGYCCMNGCRHCPYPKDDQSKNSSRSL